MFFLNKFSACFEGLEWDSRYVIIFPSFAGVILGAFILKGAMLHSPGFNTPRLDYSTGKVLIVRERWGLTILWLASHFSIQVIFNLNVNAAE